jgi:hypothetical protein
MNKKSEMMLNVKLDELFKEPEDITAEIKMCGYKLIDELLTYKKEEISYMLNNEYFLIKLISRLNDYPTAMWSGRIIILFKMIIKSIKEIEKELKIKLDITPDLFKQLLNLENIIEVTRFLEKKSKNREIVNQLINYLNGLPSFDYKDNKVRIISKDQHFILMSQITEKLQILNYNFNYNYSNFNIKELEKIKKFKNF